MTQYAAGRRGCGPIGGGQDSKCVINSRGSTQLGISGRPSDGKQQQAAQTSLSGKKHAQGAGIAISGRQALELCR